MNDTVSNAVFNGLGVELEFSKKDKKKLALCLPNIT